MTAFPQPPVHTPPKAACQHPPAAVPHAAHAPALQLELSRLGGYVPPGRCAAAVYIMSYDVFRLNQATVYSKNFELVICDEAHRLKVRFVVAA